jgi:hypothetical protein
MRCRSKICREVEIVQPAGRLTCLKRQLFCNQAKAAT